MLFNRMVPAVLLALELTDTCTAFPAATPWVAFYLLSFVGSPVNGSIYSFILFCSDSLSSSIWFCMYFAIAVLFRPTVVTDKYGQHHRRLFFLLFTLRTFAYTSCSEVVYRLYAFCLQIQLRILYPVSPFVNNTYPCCISRNFPRCLRLWCDFLFYRLLIQIECPYFVRRLNVIFKQNI